MPGGQRALRARSGRRVEVSQRALRAGEDRATDEMGGMGGMAREDSSQVAWQGRRRAVAAPANLKVRRICVAALSRVRTHGQNSGLCIGTGQKSALCIGFGRKSAPFPPRRETPVRVLSQKPSSQARLHFKTLQGDFRTYTQSRFLTSTYTQSRFLTATYTQSRFLTAGYAFRR